MTLFDINRFDDSGRGKPSGTSPEMHNRMPLAARMRPRTFEEFAGQEHLIGSGKILRKCVESDVIPSLIFWGPPGSGKTTLATVIANVTRMHFTALSAVTAGVHDLRKATEEARQRRKLSGQGTILFIDEIHRFNKAQQDAVLPFVEDGDVVLIGATTENPSFEVIAPLLSRSRVFTLNALTDDDIRLIASRALADNERGLGNLDVEISDDALAHLVVLSNGDARSALNTLEMAVLATAPAEDGSITLGLDTIEDALQHRALQYDKGGEQHYDLISALHKSLRGSDPDAGLYWLARMLEAGEDPLYIVRRLIRFASEDVGMADPRALQIAVAAQQAVHFIGLPEGNLALAQAVVYLATAPKSNSLYTAYGRVREDVQRTRNDPVPLHLRNAPTRLMKDLGYGEGYKYAHNFREHYVSQQNLPDAIKNKRYYFTSNQGFEKEVAARLKYWRGLRGEEEK